VSPTASLGSEAASAILVVEDDAQTAELERRALVRAGKRVRAVGEVRQALAAMAEESFSAILLDYRLPDGEPWPVLEAARQALPPIPVILVTAMGDERVAAEVIHRGGADYLIKTEGFWEHLTGAIERVLKVARIEQTNARLAALVESSDDAIFSQSLAGEILSWNAGAERLFGYTAGEAVGQPVALLFPAGGAVEAAAIAERTLRGETTRQLETVRIRKDGCPVEVSLTVSPVIDGGGAVVSAASICRDITSRKRAERRIAARNEITRAIAESTTVAGACPALLRGLCEGLGWRLGAMWVLDPGGGELRCAGEWHRDETLDALGAAMLQAARAPGSFPGESWAEGRVAVARDPLAGAAAELRRAAVEAGISGTLVFPVVARGEVRGMVELLGGGIAPVEPQLAEWLTAVGSQVGQFVDECLANERLRDSERWLRLALEAARMGVWDLDLASKECTRSLRHDQIYGYDELQPRWSTDIFARHVLSEDEPRVRAAFARALGTGELHLECRVRWPDGTVHWIAVEGKLLRDPAGRPMRLIGVITEITARKAAEEALRERAELDHTLFVGSPLPMWLYDVDTLRIRSVNDAAVRQYGWSREELLAMTLRDVRAPEDVPALHAAFSPELPSYHHAGIFRHRKKDGTPMRVDVHVADVWIGGRRSRLALLQDVTENQRLEEQLRQSQKMEAIGQLAGGIAHDFNNLLTIVNGYADHLLARSHAGAEGFDELSEIRQAGERAASLTRQLLSFSRRREVDLRILDLNSVVTDMNKLVRRLIGEHFELAVNLSPVLGTVRMDAGQLEQVIMNLAVNARDAMGEGGTLTIETSNVEVDEAFTRTHVGVTPGPYVVLSVTDTGCGMDEAVMRRIFEPFFTTKELGRGTGLGLATVFGIVEQSGGHIYVYSEQGRGSTFKVFLPRVDSDPSPRPERMTAGETRRGGETVLVVEDDEQVRRLTALILSQGGYHVLEAAGPERALAIVGERGGQIALIVSDVVMPGMDGPALVRRIAETRPELPALFLSGYTGRTVKQIGGLGGDAPFLEKPFTPQALLAKVRTVLDRG
jgi:hypothetical protein